MDASPGTGSEVGPHQAGEEDGHHEVQRDGAQTHPESAIRRAERNDEGQPPDVDIGVEDAREHVHAEKDDGEYRDATVELLLRETGPSATRESAWLWQFREPSST